MTHFIPQFTLSGVMLSRLSGFNAFLLLLLTAGCVAKSGNQMRFIQSQGLSTPNFDIQGVNDGNFSFLFVGDVHLGGNDTQRLQTILQAAQTHGDSFVVFLGDITDQGERSDMETVISKVSEFGFEKKTIYILGNHDVFKDGWSAWKELMGPSHFDVVIGNTQFFILDSADGVVGEEQTEWLDGEMRKSVATHKIILSHYMPIIPGQRTYLKLSNQVEGASLMKLLSRHRARAWLGGHYHSFVSENIEGVNYVVAGGGGGRRMEPIKSNFYVRALVNGGEIQFQLHPF